MTRQARRAGYSDAMRKLLPILVLAACSAWALDQTDPKNFKPVEALALKGDYQAQRNLAFGYVDTPYIGQAMNPILGCAWYLVVLHSGSRQVGMGDAGNVRVHCDKLDANSRAASTAQARELYRTIYKRPPKF